jgi:hypothetical protein
MLMEDKSMAHRRALQNHIGVQPQYEWAFDAAGQPVPITKAIRSETYFCPLCNRRMVARMGEIKRHHFSHDEEHNCPPEEVARAAAGRWLERNIQQCLTNRQAIIMTWTCALCKQQHTADLLKGITQVQANYSAGDISADVALLDAGGKLRVAILLKTPDPAMMAAFFRDGVTTIGVDAVSAPYRMRDLPSLLSGSTIYGGLCTTQQAAKQKGVVVDVPALRDQLIAAANQSPFYAYGPLETSEGLTHVFTLNGKKLWLPPILWQRAIGGMLHSLSPALQILSQEWTQPDGAVIALYYITMKDSQAIAVRRFAPGNGAYARIELPRTGRMTALSVARCFAEL